jgi:excisionase family DNA binding protein
MYTSSIALRASEAQCLTVKINVAAKILGISRNTAYEAARTGAIPVVKIGKRLLVPKVALDRLLDSAGQSI